MSALTIDEAMTTYTPVRPVRRLSTPLPAARHAGAVRLHPARSGEGRSRPASVAPVRLGVPEPTAATWQLTDRGIAVIVVGFLLLCAIATAVAIGAFLAVPNTPLAPTPGGAVPVLSGH